MSTAMELADFLASTLPTEGKSGDYWDVVIDRWRLLDDTETLLRAIQRAAEICARRARILQEEAANLRPQVEEDARLRIASVPKHQEAAMELCSYLLNDTDTSDVSGVIRERWPDLSKGEILWASDLAEKMMDLFDRLPPADR
jgi:hypothetical protein